MGATGATGAAGAQRGIGATGVQGPLAGGQGWSPCREYQFNAYDDELLRGDSDKASEVARYMDQNPSMRVGIDGMNATRVDNVRSALIGAGVPAYKIRTGPFGDPQLRNDARVAVLLSSN